MDRRDFLKTVAVSGAAMTIQRSEAMEILTQAVNSTGKPDLVAVMGDEPSLCFKSTCHCRIRRDETVCEVRSKGSCETQYWMG